MITALDRKALAAETAGELLKSLRLPQFLVPTLTFPIAFYTLFGIVLAPGGGQTAVYLLATFGIFATLGPGLFGLGYAAAAEREQGWLDLKRASPLPAWAFLVAKLAMALIFSTAVLALLYPLAVFGAGVRLSGTQRGLMALAHILSVLPFSLIGLAVGLALRTQTAAAVLNIGFFVLAALGGLWLPLMLFPAPLQLTAQFLPTTHWGALALAAVGQAPNHPLWLHLIAASGFTVLAGLAAWAAWTRATAR